MSGWPDDALESDPIATGGVRLARTLGTASFCPGFDPVLLGWSADGATLHLTRTLSFFFRLWSMDARSGALRSVRDLSGNDVAAAAPAGPGRAVVESAGRGRFALWDLDTATLDGEVRLEDAPASTLALPAPRHRPRMQARVADLRCLAGEEPRDDRDLGATSIDRALFLRALPEGRAPRVGVFDASGDRLWTLKATRDDPITHATFTADRGVMVAFRHGALGCWDLDRRAWRWRDPRHWGEITALVRAPDGRTFYSLGLDGRLFATDADGRTRWEAALGRKGFALGRHGDVLGGVAPSPDGRWVAVGLGDSVRVVDAESGDDRSVLDGHAGAVTCLAVSPDGRLLASGGSDGAVRVYEAHSGDERWVLETDGAGVIDVAFRADRPSLLAHDRSGVGLEWSLQTGLELSRVTEGALPSDRIVATTDGDRVLVTCGHRRRMWIDRSPDRSAWSYEVPTRKYDGDGWWSMLRSGQGRDGFSGDGARVLTTWPVTGPDGEPRSQLLTLDAETGRVLGSPRRVPGQVLGVVHGDGQTRLLAVTREGYVVLDEEGRETPGRVLTSSPTAIAALSRDHRTLAFMTVGHLVVWRLGSPSRRIGVISPPLHESVTALALSPDGRTLVVGTSRGRVWLFAIDGEAP